jgi:K+-transporting ATPase c subunit
MNFTARQGYRQHHTLLQRELGQWAAGLELGITPLHQRIVHTLDWLDMERLLGYAGPRVGAPERSRVALAHAFVAKAVLGFERTTQLRSRLAVDTVLRRLLGFESNRPLPSEATFSRAFAEFARLRLPGKAHEALIRQHLGASVIGHIARDATAICARERAQYSVAETAAFNAANAAKADKALKAPRRRGRPAAGSAKLEKAAPRSRIPAQLLQTPQEALADLPQLCNKGKKRNAQGHFNTWVGYKLHLDVACCGVPITAVLTSASVYDNQVSVPLARLSAQRVTSLYTLMDAAYDSEPLRQLERELGHVPIVAINSRGRENPPTLDAAEKKRFGERTVVERVNSRLKDSFGCASMWVKGHAKVLCHTTFAVLAVSVDALMRLMLYQGSSDEADQFT